MVLLDLLLSDELDEVGGAFFVDVELGSFLQIQEDLAGLARLQPRPTAIDVDSLDRVPQSGREQRTDLVIPVGAHVDLSDHWGRSRAVGPLDPRRVPAVARAVVEVDRQRVEGRMSGA